MPNLTYKLWTFFPCPSSNETCLIWITSIKQLKCYPRKLAAIKSSLHGIISKCFVAFRVFKKVKIKQKIKLLCVYYKWYYIPYIRMCIKHCPHQCCPGSGNSPDEYKGHISIISVHLPIRSDNVFLEEIKLLFSIRKYVCIW